MFKKLAIGPECGTMVFEVIMTNRTPKRPLGRDEMIQWSQQAQVFVLDQLMKHSRWTHEQVAFHGGTSLRLSWQCPRYSEDLDFLLARNVQDIEDVFKKVTKGVNEQFVAMDPHFQVEIVNKTKDPDRMPVFHVKIAHEHVLGKVTVKVEFWKVDPGYLAQYPCTFKVPTHKDMMSQITHGVPAASLHTVFCDKLTAFATRPYLKWRDVYDLWWVGTQTHQHLPLQNLVSQFQHNLSGYQLPEGLSASQSLRRWFSEDRAFEVMVQQSDPDLKNWLPESLWQHLKRHGMIEEMVRYAQQTLEAMAQLCDTPQPQRGIKP